jgi:hypothetical protein
LQELCRLSIFGPGDAFIGLIMTPLTQIISRRPNGPLVLAALLGALALGACTTPAPPKPAMVPLGQTGDFGYSAHDLDANRIEVTYIGASVKVPTDASRNAPAVQAELAKTRDLALWRAAQIADERGMAAMKIEKESSDTDVNVRRDYVQRPYPFGYGYGGFCCGYRHYGYYGSPWWFNDYPYYYAPVNRAAGRVTTTLTVQLFKVRNTDDATQLSVADTLSKMKTERTGAVY